MSTFVRRETTIYRCRYSRDVHRTKCQALTIARLTHSRYTRKIARIRRYTILDNILSEVSAYSSEQEGWERVAIMQSLGELSIPSNRTGARVRNVSPGRAPLSKLTV